jgi:exoribonuclease R
MVSFEVLDEYFTVDPGGLRAVSTSGDMVFRRGDIVKVRILDADPQKRQIEMELVL